MFSGVARSPGSNWESLHALLQPTLASLSAPPKQRTKGRTSLILTSLILTSLKIPCWNCCDRVLSYNRKIF